MAPVCADYARKMAAYSAWQNKSLLDAADSLPDPERFADRGAFFGSIFGTLNHLLWADRIWMSRFTDTPPPDRSSIPESVRETPDWDTYKTARAAQDCLICDWAAELDDARVSGDLTWYSGAAGREISRPVSVLLMHFFNHATHHRGQVHAMLTAAGARPGDTDLFLMPDL